MAMSAGPATPVLRFATTGYPDAARVNLRLAPAAGAVCGEPAPERHRPGAQLGQAAGLALERPQPGDVEDEPVVLARRVDHQPAAPEALDDPERQPPGRQRDPGADVEDAARMRLRELDQVPDV